MLNCEECATPPATVEEAFRWRAYLTSVADGDGDLEVAVYCPGCADREFGDRRRLDSELQLRLVRYLWLLRSASPLACGRGHVRNGHLAATHSGVSSVPVGPGRGAVLAPLTGVPI